MSYIIKLNEHSLFHHVDINSVAELIDNIGTPKFVNSLLNFCETNIRADFVSIISYNPEKLPEVVETATTTSDKNARKAASNYLQHFQDDPNYKIALSGQNKKETYLTYQKRSDIGSLAYRRACYDTTNIEDRFSLVRTGQLSQMSINVYRSHHSGIFANNAAAKLSNFGPILISAIDKHYYAQKRKKAETVEDQEYYLKKHCPQLTTREMQVSALVLAGLTANEIAQKLSISPTTVITHRKKAYARLGVKNLRDLLQLRGTQY